MRFRLEFISLELVKADAVVAWVSYLNLGQISDEHKFFLLGDVQRPCTEWFWLVGPAGALSEAAVEKWGQPSPDGDVLLEKLFPLSLVFL